MKKGLAIVLTAMGVGGASVQGYHTYVNACLPEPPIVDGPAFPVGIGPTGELMVAIEVSDAIELARFVTEYEACSGRSASSTPPTPEARAEKPPVGF